MILLSKIDKEMISGGNIDYKGVNPGENPPTPEVFSKWGWTNSYDKLKLTYTLNINQGHTALHNIDIKDQLAFTDGKNQKQILLTSIQELGRSSSLKMVPII